MSQFPQGGFNQQQFQGPQGGFAPQQQQNGFVPQQQQFQQPQQQMPQMQKVMYGQGYAPGQFPHLNECHMIGQVFPNQWMPQGLEFKPSDKGGQININVKVRNAWGSEPHQVKIQFIRVVAFGAIAQQLSNQLRAGMMIEFQGEFRPNKYQSKKTNKLTNVNQIILSARQNQPAPLKVLGELPMYEEVNPNQGQYGGGGGGGNWNGGGQAQGQQGQWGGQQQMPAQGNFQQAPQGQQQFAPQGQQFAPQGQPQQFAPQGQQQFAPPQGQFAPPQGQQFAPQGAPPMGQAPMGAPGNFGAGQPAHPAAGMPQSPAPGQMNGTFAPPQGAPMGQPQGQFQPPVGAPPQGQFQQPNNPPMF